MKANGSHRPQTGPRVNSQIRMPTVRVIGEDGANLGVMSNDAARDKASEAGMDLVEVQPGVRPPVCKIIDYGKYKYEQKKKQKEQKKNQVKSDTKEIRIRPKTEIHDLETKAKSVRKFLESGNKCQITVKFKGRENSHPETGNAILQKFMREVSDVARVETAPKHEGRQITMLVAPK